MQDSMIYEYGDASYGCSAESMEFNRTQHKHMIIFFLPT